MSVQSQMVHSCSRNFTDYPFGVGGNLSGMGDYYLVL